MTHLLGHPGLLPEQECALVLCFPSGAAAACIYLTLHPSCPLPAAEEERALLRRRRCCLRLAGEAAVVGITGNDVSHLLAMVQVSPAFICALASSHQVASTDMFLCPTGCHQGQMCSFAPPRAHMTIFPYGTPPRQNEASACCQHWHMAHYTCYST